ncbi:MAG: FAD-dependent oxidoreductase [Polyangiaceae bacterium]|nr:FAD-dependent oxidoreductase [Polyangiaceae bacterium]
MQRRAFLSAVAGGWVASSVLPDRRPVHGRIMGASHSVGHALRGNDARPAALNPADIDAALPGREIAAPAPFPDRTDVLIVGGGASGLSAAWRLAALGVESVVCELEPFVGGTSTYGTAGASAHPWGAHYLAAPNPEARAALRLLREMGVVTGWDAAGRPMFDGRHLCHAPEERLFYAGEWWQGLVPVDALTADEREEMRRFRSIADEWTTRIGSDGRPAFDIPVRLSSKDPDVLALDRRSFAEWLTANRFTSPFVRWYVRYAVLDDYGGEPETISAWAGLHYFAARKLKSQELLGSHFLVWPEGNGRLIRELCERSQANVYTNALVTSLTEERGSVRATVLNAYTGERRTIEARAAVLAIPAFVASKITRIGGAPWPKRTASPWVVANLHTGWPANPDLPWDSVLFDAKGLGYVHAQHQQTVVTEQPVVTYYRAYGDADVAGARQSLLAKPWIALAEEIIADLMPAHPHIRDEVERMDIMVWGHAMPRPEPGFLGSDPFAGSPLISERIAWAHVDQAGIALFEEAQDRGVRAAEAVAPLVGKDPGETWL